MVINDFIQLMVNIINVLIGLYKSVTLSFSGLTVNYWQILMGFVLIGFIIYAFWKGAKTQ